MKILRAECLQKIDQIKLLVMDFDGVLTDNYVYTTSDGQEFVKCWRGDGLGLAKLKSIGVRLLVISSESNSVVEKRCRKLGIECRSNVSCKQECLSELARELGFPLDQIAYIGNDENDRDVMRFVGIPIGVSDHHDSLSEVIALKTESAGGAGAVREVCEFIYSWRDSSARTQTSSKFEVAQFPHPETVGPRIWGEETVLVVAPQKYMMKKP